VIRIKIILLCFSDPSYSLLLLDQEKKSMHATHPNLEQRNPYDLLLKISEVLIEEILIEMF